MSRTVLFEIDGWTPLPDLLVNRYGLVTAAVFGKMWRYCQGKDGVCRAKLETIAKELNLSRMTVIRHIETLVADGFMEDTTPELRNRPHIYADTGKVAMYNKFGMGLAVTESDSRVTESDSQSHTELLEDTKKRVSKKERNAPDFSNMTVSEAYKIPTLKLYKEAAGFFPPDILWRYVHEYITENKLTSEKIRRAAVEWSASGFKRSNVKGILEWARDGIPQKSNGYKPQESVSFEDALVKAGYV